MMPVHANGGHDPARRLRSSAHLARKIELPTGRIFDALHHVYTARTLGAKPVTLKLFWSSRETQGRPRHCPFPAPRDALNCNC
jgi:hypothetical protein